MITLWRCYKAIEAMVVLRWCYDGNRAELLLRSFTAMAMLFTNLSLQVSLWLVKVLSCSEIYLHTEHQYFFKCLDIKRAHNTEPKPKI